MISYIQAPSKYGPGFSEGIVEHAALDFFASLGYEVANGSDVAPDTPEAERVSYGEVILRRRLVAAVERLNPTIPEDVRADVSSRLLLLSRHR